MRFAIRSMLFCTFIAAFSMRDAEPCVPSIVSFNSSAFHCACAKASAVCSTCSLASCMEPPAVSCSAAASACACCVTSPYRVLTPSKVSCVSESALFCCSIAVCVCSIWIFKSEIRLLSSGEMTKLFPSIFVFACNAVSSAFACSSCATRALFFALPTVTSSCSLRIFCSSRVNSLDALLVSSLT